jgi:predicted ATPase
MTQDEIEQAARESYEASREDGQSQLPWADLPAFAQNVWRDLVRGNAGAAVD